MSTEAKPAEAPAVAEGEAGAAPVDPAEAETPAEGVPVEGDGAETPEEGKEGEPAAEGEEKLAEEAAKPAEIPEETLKAAATKYANRTMAAARRAQSQVETVKAESEKLSTSLKAHQDFVEELRTTGGAALAKIGLTVKQFLQLTLDSGGEAKEPTVEDQIAALKKEREDEKAARAKADQAAKIEASKRDVFAAIDKDSGRYDLASTDEGHELLWEAIEAYSGIHGDVPDAAVFALADMVEKRLEERVTKITAKSRKFTVQRQDAEKPGAPAAASAAPAARNAAKTLTNRATSGAPAVREYSLDPDERRRQVNEDMRANGEL